MEPNSLSTRRLQDQIYFFCELPFSVSVYPLACLCCEETARNLHVSKQTFLADLFHFDI